MPRQTQRPRLALGPPPRLLLSADSSRRPYRLRVTGPRPTRLHNFAAPVVSQSPIPHHLDARHRSHVRLSDCSDFSCTDSALGSAYHTTKTRSRVFQPCPSGQLRVRLSSLNPPMSDLLLLWKLTHRRSIGAARSVVTAVQALPSPGAIARSRRALLTSRRSRTISPWRVPRNLNCPIEIHSSHLCDMSDTRNDHATPIRPCVVSHSRILQIGQRGQ